MKQTINENSVSLDKNLVINGSEYTIDNPKLVEFFLSFEGRNTFTGVVKDKDVIAHYVNGELHRDNGPAVEWASGSKEWWFNGEYHRVDGPAMELANGRKEWLFHGKHYGSNDAYTNESWIAYVATLK